MRHLVVLFIFICLKSIVGYGCAHTGAHNNVIGISTNNTVVKTQLERTVLKHDFLLAENVDFSEDSFSEIGVEDEDESEDIIKKHLSSVRYSLAFNYAFIVSYQHSLVANRIPLCSYPSYSSSSKYIVQRALRI